MKHLLWAGAVALAWATAVFGQTATSVAMTGSVTSSGATGPCVFASGTATCGPFLPSQRLPVRLLLKGGASFTATIGTSVDNCASVNALTTGGTVIGYSGSVDEYVDVPPTTGNIGYCLVLAVASGTEAYAVRQ